MITFVVLRHGQAQNRATTDFERQLTDKGNQDCHYVAEQLKLNQQRFSQDNPIEAIYHSPYIRTTQTAEIVRGDLEVSVELAGYGLPMYPVEPLVGNDSVVTVTQWISGLPEKKFLLVSHQPLVSSLVAWLVDGAEPSDYSVVSRYPMHPASFAILECDVIGRGCCNLVSLNHV